jgi:hypothetical protein
MDFRNVVCQIWSRLFFIFCFNWLAGVEDRATLGSDLSAVSGQDRRWGEDWRFSPHAPAGLSKALNPRGFGGRVPQGVLRPGHFFVGIQDIDFGAAKRGIDGLAYFFARLPPGFEVLLSQLADDLSDLESQPRLDLLQGCPAAFHQVPNGHGEFARHRGDRQGQGTLAEGSILALSHFPPSVRGASNHRLV